MTLFKRIMVCIARAVTIFEEYFIAANLCLLTMLICVQVLLRYMLAKSVLGYEELARYSMIWLAFVGAAYATRCKAHIKVDILSLIIRNKVTQQKAGLVLDFLSFAFFCAFLYWLYVLILASGYRTPALGIPIWVPQLALIVGNVLMITYFLSHFIQGIRDLGDRARKPG